MTTLRHRRLAPLSALLLMAGSAACEADPGFDDLCALPLPATSGWSLHDEGVFTLLLPPEYQKVAVQGVDSQVGRWEAPGKQVGYDFGPYSNSLQHDVNTYPDLSVCQEGDGSGTPRIALHSPPDGGYAVSAHWADVRAQEPRGSESLTLEAVVERPQDRAEILAAIASVRFGPSEAAAEAAAGGGSALSDSTAAAPGDRSPLLTPEGWGPIRIGMTRAEVVAAAGEDANPGAVGGPEPEACDQFRPEQAPPGLLVMVERDTVTRITLSGGTGIVTDRGFGVGDPAAAIEETYGAEAVVAPHKYSPAPAAYITVWATPPGNSSSRGIVYEIGTDGRVMHVHAGGPSIQYVEGCL